MFVLDEADDMIENFAAECMATKTRCIPRGGAPPQTLLFSASFECLEAAHPGVDKAKRFTDQVGHARALHPPTATAAARSVLRHCSHAIRQIRPATSPATSTRGYGSPVRGVCPTVLVAPAAAADH
jgi:hypothetical protein